MISYKEIRSQIERPYHNIDVSLLLRRNVSKEECYTIEFQKWFISNLGKCDKHNYPFLWHQSITKNCPKCLDN